MDTRPAVNQITVERVVTAIESVIRKRRGSALEIAPDARLEDLGLNSLDFADVFVTIEEAVGYELDPESAEEVELVRDLATLRPL